MKKILNASLLLTSLIGYLEWGKGQSAFLFQVEAELFMKAKDGPESFFHPLILLPLLGQIMICYTLFQRTPGRTLSLIGLAGLSMILLFICFVGLISLNYRTVGSTIPFIVVGVLVLRYNWKRESWHHRESS